MILVFGADGFIGGYLMEGLGNRATDFDGVDINTMPWPKSDGAINLIGLQPARGDFWPEQYITVNVLGFLRLLELLRASNVRKVLTCFSQKREFKGKYAMFSISEHCAIDCLEYYHQEHGMQTIALRLPPVYGWGPFLKGSGFMTFMENARDGKPIEVWGDPYVTRDWIDVRDVVQAITNLIDSDAQGEYQISGGLVSLDDEVRIINEAWGNKSEVIYWRDKANGLKSSSVYLNMARIESYWEPRYTFEDTVKEIKRRMEECGTV